MQVVTRVLFVLCVCLLVCLFACIDVRSYTRMQVCLYICDVLWKSAITVRAFVCVN